MEILIRPVHNKMWGYKHKKKPLTLHNLFFDGAGFIILHNWFWWIMFLFLFGIYILFYSIIKAQLLGIILGLIVTALGILKGYYFLNIQKLWKNVIQKEKIFRINTKLLLAEADIPSCLSFLHLMKCYRFQLGLILLGELILEIQKQGLLLKQVLKELLRKE